MQLQSVQASRQLQANQPTVQHPFQGNPFRVQNQGDQVTFGSDTPPNNFNDKVAGLWETVTRVSQRLYEQMRDPVHGKANSAILLKEVVPRALIWNPLGWMGMAGSWLGIRAAENKADALLADLTPAQIEDTFAGKLTHMATEYNEATKDDFAQRTETIRNWYNRLIAENLLTEEADEAVKNKITMTEKGFSHRKMHWALGFKTHTESGWLGKHVVKPISKLAKRLGKRFRIMRFAAVPLTLSNLVLRILIFATKPSIRKSIRLVP